MNIFSFLKFKALPLSYLLLGFTILEKFADSASKLSKCGSVFITVSAYYTNCIVLNWVNNCGPNDVKPDIVILTREDIRNKTGYSYLEFATARSHSSGSYTTDFEISRWDNWYKGKSVNLGYWITSLTPDKKIIDTRPFRLYPTWMYDNREKLKSMNIGKMVIPGTHNSGCYDGYGMFKGYLYNQEYSVRKQLEAGIRYFDFRIGYYENDGFYINHDFVWIKPMEEIYNDIMSFLRDSPGEIIIIDYHRFPKPDEWSRHLHNKFLRFTFDKLGSKIFKPRGYDSVYNYKGPTMEEIWESGKNIIITYPSISVEKEFDPLLQPVRQLWADSLSVGDVKDLFRRISHPQTFTALMAILTFRPIDIFLIRNTLRKLADDINPEITKWVRDEWRDKIYIVATDFFLGNNLIEIAIDININK